MRPLPDPGLPLGISLRRAKAEDAPQLQALERRAAARFHTVGMPAVARSEPVPESRLIEAAHADRLLMLEQDNGRQAIGMLLWRPVAAWLWIEELDIDPEWAGRRLGRTLLWQALLRSQQDQMAGLALTTFRHVPWNAPYYERLGFQECPADRLPSEFAEILRSEAARFPQPRCLLLLPQGSNLLEGA